MHGIGTSVYLLGDTGLTGVVVGYGTLDRDVDPSNYMGGVVPVYLVSLSSGFFDPSQRLFVSVLAVHEDSLKVVPAPVVVHESGCALGRCATCC
jgi:hypothetical protein